MPPKQLPQPTGVELEILNVLWDHGPSIVREIHQVLAENRETGYSTTLKLVQVMRYKGLLKRDTSVRPQIYRPVRKNDETQVAMLDDQGYLPHNIFRSMNMSSIVMVYYAQMRTICALVLIAIWGGWAEADEPKAKRLADFEKRLFSDDENVLLPLFRQSVNRQLRDITVEQRVPLVLRYLKQIKSRPDVAGTDRYERVVQETLFLEGFVREAGRRAAPIAPELLRLTLNPENWSYVRGRFVQLLWILQPDDPELIDQMKEWLGDRQMNVALRAANCLAKTAQPDQSMLDAIEARIAIDDIQTELIEHAAAIELKLNPMTPSSAVRMLARPESHSLVRLGAAIRCLRESDPEDRGDVETRYRVHLIALSKHKDRRIRWMTTKSMETLPPSDSRDIAARVLDLISKQHGDLSGTLDKIRPFPPELINRAAKLLARQESSHSWTTAVSLMAALGSTGPRAAVALPELLLRYEAYEKQIVSSAEKKDAKSPTTPVMNWHLWRACKRALIDIGPGDSRVHDIMLRRFVPGAPVFDAWSATVLAQDRPADQSLYITRVLREPERLSWPNSKARHHDLYVLSRDLVLSPTDYTLRAGCEILINLEGDLTSKEIHETLPPMEKALAIQLEPLQKHVFGALLRITVLKALQAFGPRARPALEAVERLAKMPTPKRSYTNHQLIKIIQQARQTQAAILGD